jgi:peptidoglycan/LPS O-acetylase OafA/YrhL
VTTAATAPKALERGGAASRLEYIDGLRALAALWVLLHHAIETSEPTRAMSSKVIGPVLGTLFFGQFPVMVFLMLSGFCLYFPFIKKNPLPEFNVSFRAYLTRRFMRIYPPYFWAGVLCLALLAIPGLTVGRWSITAPVDGWVVTSHLLLFHNLIPAHATKIDYPMWSIGLEWQLYLFFPLLVWAFRRIGALPTIVATLLIAAALRATYRDMPPGIGPIFRDGPLAYLMIFAAGMLAAKLSVGRETLRLPRWVLFGVFGLGLLAVRFGSGNGLVHDLATTGAFFCLLLLATDGNSATARFLSNPWLVRIGFFSYSLYLVHAPILHLTWMALRPLDLSHDAMFAGLVLLGTPLSLSLSYGFHVLFERPFMRVKHAPVQPAVAPGGG